MAKEVKNGRSKVYVMDGAALAKIFEKKGINARQFGKELGYHETYFPKCIRTNKIGEKAIGMLMWYKILPSQYGVEAIIATTKTVGEVFDELPKETKEEVCKQVEEAVEEATERVSSEVKRNSGRYPWGDEKSPVEKAMNEPGVVKLEFTIDIVKLKAVVKQAVKEAYEEL